MEETQVTKPPRPPSYEVLADLHEIRDVAEAKNFLVANAQECRSAGKVMKGIFLHPQNDADATLTYRMRLPRAQAGDRMFLLTWTTVNDDVNAKKEPKWNGVRFIIRVNGETKLSRDQMPGGWVPAAIPLDEVAGTTVALQLATNPIDGDSNYDWSYYGLPQVVCIRPEPLGANGKLPGLAGVILAPSDSVTEGGTSISVQPLGASDEPVGEVQKIDLPEAPASLWTIAQFDFSGIDGAFGARVLKPAESLPAGALLSPYSSIVDVLGPFVGNAFIVPGAEAPVTIVLKNRGMGAWAPRHGRMKVVMDGESAETSDFKPLPPGQEHVLRVKLRPKRTGRRVLRVELAAEGLQTLRSTHLMMVDQAPPQLDAARKPGLSAECDDSFASIQNDEVRIVAVKMDGGRCFTWFQRSDGSRWRTLAVQPALVEVVVDAQPEPVICAVRAISLSASKQDGAACLKGVVGLSGPSGVKMEAEAAYTIGAGGLVDVRCVLRAPPGARILRFCGPSLRVSDKSGGEHKRAALFPGLEYLGPDEPSSSTRDAAPPINNRLCPDRLKITVPLMTVCTDDGLVAMMWDANQLWDGANASPAAVFASPNHAERSDNHLMELYVPAPVEFGGENQRAAQKPCEVPASGSLTIGCQILLKKPEDVLTAVDAYIERYGLPAPQKRPHDVQTTYTLSRLGFLRTVWDEKLEKSCHCVGWDPTNGPQFALMLWLDSKLAGEPAERKVSLERSRLIIQNTIRDDGPTGLASGSCCHILWGQLPFYTGHLKHGLEGLIGSADGILRGQKPDGSWVFNPRTEKHASLGKAGDATQGIVANCAFRLLRVARLTGYQPALEGGMKALEFHERYKIPHGAQGWECPIYQPDVLGAGYAVAAYLEAYALTGEKKHLDKAVYWARTGIPFHYLWQDAGTPEWMLYAGIPVFGTTFYTHSWFGMPVQWCSLVHAYHVQHLAECDDSFPWKQLVEGITVSAEWQQVGTDDPALVGSYPDSLGKRMTKRNPAFINPEDIYLNRVALEGHDPEIRTIIRRDTPLGQVSVSSCARLDGLEVSGSQLRVGLRFWPSESSGTVAVGTPKPVKVSFDGEDLPEVEALWDVEAGWRYVPERKWLLIRCRHEDASRRDLAVSFERG